MVMDTPSRCSWLHRTHLWLDVPMDDVLVAEEFQCLRQLTQKASHYGLIETSFFWMRELVADDAVDHRQGVQPGDLAFLPNVLREVPGAAIRHDEVDMLFGFLRHSRDEN